MIVYEYEYDQTERFVNSDLSSGEILAESYRLCRQAGESHVSAQASAIAVMQAVNRRRFITNLDREIDAYIADCEKDGK